MVQKVNIVLIDDTDGSEAAETVTFGLDGATYEIDLSTENAERLRSDLAGWVGAARRHAGRKASARPARSGSSRGRSDAAQIRQWAEENGHNVSSRGRIPAEVRAAYEAAH